jgi:hypothetical protein
MTRVVHRRSNVAIRLARSFGIWGACLTLAGAAAADTISFTLPLSTSVTAGFEIQPDETEGYGEGQTVLTPSLPGFDPLLGTLLGWSLHFEGDVTLDAEISASGGTASVPHVATVATVVLRRGASSQQVNVSQLSLSCAGSPACSDTDSTSGSIDNLTNGGASALPPIEITSRLQFGTFPIGPTEGHVLGDASFDWEGTLTVTYQYHPIPEPGTIALLLGGLGILGATHRTRS